MPFTPDAPSRCEALLAEDEATAEGVGFALFFPNYSTFLTRRGFYLENLYVVPAARGRGAGLAWLQRVARSAAERGCERLDRSVLAGNDPALAPYRKLDARTMDGRGWGCDWKGTPCSAWRGGKRTTDRRRAFRADSGCYSIGTMRPSQVMRSVGPGGRVGKSPALRSAPQSLGR